MLSKFANEKKSPVGYRAFAAACIKYVCVDVICMYLCMYFNLLCFRSNGRHDRPESEIEKYVEKMTDLEEKYEVIHFASHCVYYLLFFGNISTT